MSDHMLDVSILIEQAEGIIEAVVTNRALDEEPARHALWGALGIIRQAHQISEQAQRRKPDKAN